jgi:hypothetical protein
METFIIVLFVVFVLIVSMVIEDISQNNLIKKRKQILTKGRRVVFYECINKEFDDWKKLAEGTIVDCKDTTFKIEYTDGKTTYEKYWRFGMFDDKVEVYDGNELIWTTGFSM